VTTLEAVTGVLRARRIPFALIGATAMAVHGVSRSTADIDLLTTDAAALDEALWTGLPSRIAVDIRRGDAADPLAGVVRFRAAGEPDVDVMVGRGVWQTGCVTRAAVRIDGDLPVATRADVILLKLYAGGPQDAWDITQLLDADVGREAVAAVDARVASLPGEAQALWGRLRR
jgi:hypothetical protein